MSLNRVICSGNIGREPELRRTQSGMGILGFSLAVNDRRKNQQTGEWEDYCNWVDVSIFGKRAESLANILSKGMKVCIEGKLRWSQWTNKDGQKRSKLEVIADEIEFMSKGDGGSQGGYQNQGGTYQASTSDSGPVIDVDPYQDDIPF